MPGKTHMIIVKKPHSSQVTGIITLEDIIEEILQTEINDEADYQSEKIRTQFNHLNSTEWGFFEVPFKISSINFFPFEFFLP